MIQLKTQLAAYQMFEPFRFYNEIIYSIIIIFLFLFIYYKTRELYNITKHKGIYYFRTAFLFFALAYFFRLLQHLIRLFLRYTEFHISGRTILIVSLLIISYLGTLAIGYLIYSNLWKKIKHRDFLISINFFALLIILIFSIRFSFLIFSILQIFFIIFILIINYNKKIKILYSLISLFWLFNIIILYSRNLLSMEIKIILQIISIIILIIFNYRILKWTK